MGRASIFRAAPGIGCVAWLAVRHQEAGNGARPLERQRSDAPSIWGGKCSGSGGGISANRAKRVGECLPPTDAWQRGGHERLSFAKRGKGHGTSEMRLIELRALQRTARVPASSNLMWIRAMELSRLRRFALTGSTSNLHTESLRSNVTMGSPSGPVSDLKSRMVGDSKVIQRLFHESKPHCRTGLESAMGATLKVPLPPHGSQLTASRPDHRVSDCCRHSLSLPVSLTHTSGSGRPVLPVESYRPLEPCRITRRIPTELTRATIA